MSKVEDEVYDSLLALGMALHNRQLNLRGLVVDSRKFPNRPYMIGTPAYEEGEEILPETIYTDFGPVEIKEEVLEDRNA